MNKKKYIIATLTTLFIAIFSFISYRIVDNYQDLGRTLKGYEITLGYHENDANGEFTDSNTKFKSRNGLKTQVRYPMNTKETKTARLTIIEMKTSTIVKEEDFNIGKNDSGQTYELNADKWSPGNYKSVLVINRKEVKAKKFELK